jgi:IS605 OrfB family transposase
LAVKKLSTKTSKGRLLGCEAIIPYHPFLDDWGQYYQSILRTAVREIIDGATEKDIEKSFQTRFNIRWSWADSIATEAAQRVAQLKAARLNQISVLKDSIGSALTYVKKQIKLLEKKISKPVTKKYAAWIEKKLLGLKQKLLRVERNRDKLAQLEANKRLKVVFGGKKLFNAQHHLEENGYSTHKEWRDDWQQARSGNFFAVGKGSAIGGNEVIGVHHIEGNWFSAEIAVPYFLREEYGNTVTVDFSLNQKHAGAVSWALNNNKPVTVRCFRREHKSDKWYISLTTYDIDVPWVSHNNNGAIGIDLNAKSIDVACVSNDGNLKWSKSYKFNEDNLSTGQRQTRLWDICAEIVKLASVELCPIVIENLDFTKKKASMREQPKGYNRMLSQFCYNKFRTSLQSRCDKRGIQLIQVSPKYSSTIGCIKFMGRYGLNSGCAAGMVLARRALRLSERVPQCLVRPEEQSRHPWVSWNRITRGIREHSIPRHSLFAWRKFPEVYSALTETRKGSRRSKTEKSTSSRVRK